LKAKSLNLNSEDYLTGKIKDPDNLFTGRSTIENIDNDVIDKIYKNGFCTPEEIGLIDTKNNKYLIIKSDKSSVLAYFNSITQKVEKIEKKTCYKITPRNSEQIFAMHALLNPDVKLVSLQGVAGTGKTLLALASALQQKKDYKQIYLARPIIPLSNKDLGFIPGSLDMKLSVYMEPLFDNLKFIQSQFKETDKEHKFITDCVKEEKLIITPLAYIRGRSISNVLFIIDEAQNLTPHEIKTVITRAGEGTKIIFTGDIHQIDTPYLDAQSNGLSILIDKMKNQQLYAHVTLEKGERSELANLANELL
jgi:PhoH-like ATPase